MLKKIDWRCTEINNFNLSALTIRDFLAMSKTHSKLLQITPKSLDLFLSPRETKSPYLDHSILFLNPQTELDFCINILGHELLFIGDFGLEIL